MKQSFAWTTGLLSLSLAVACGETANFVGDEPTAGTAGVGGTGDNAAGTSSAGATQAGSGAGGTKNSAGSGSGGSSNGGSGQGGSSTAGSGGSGPTNCKELGGNWLNCDGIVHREKPGTCESQLPRAEALPPSGGNDECTKDTDCTEKAHGYCFRLQGGFLPDPRNICMYGCLTDADCGETQACQCGGSIGTCEASSGCKSDQDCGEGLLCTEFDSCPGVPVTDFQCQSPADECATGADCKEPGKQFCGSNDQYRVCQGVICAASAGQ